MRIFAPRRWGLLLAAGLLSSVAAFGWSEQGHRIIALAAEEQLSDNAKRRLAFLLGKNGRLVDVATWAKEIVQTRPDTEAWHSITIPQGAETVDLSRDCPVGDCITVKVRDCIGIVRLAIKPREEVVEAFKMLVGLAAELHQPLMSGHPPSEGKDDREVVVRGTDMSLFEAWDGGLLASMGPEEQVLAKVRERIVSADRDAWTQGTLRDWTWENHRVARDKIYPSVGESETTVLAGAALDSASEIVVERLAKSAVRLAAMLDDMWP